MEVKPGAKITRVAFLLLAISTGLGLDPAFARQTEDQTIGDLMVTIVGLRSDIRSREVPEEERIERVEKLGRLRARLLKKSHEIKDWRGVGRWLQQNGMYQELCDLWADRWNEIGSVSAGEASLDYWHLCDSLRNVGDWAGTQEILDKMEATAGRKGLSPLVEAYCWKLAIAQKIQYLIDLGQPEKAAPLLPAYDEWFEIYPDQPEARIDLRVRYHRATGNHRTILMELDQYTAKMKDLSPNLHLQRASSGLHLARWQEDDTAPRVSELRGVLEEKKNSGRERVQAAFELFGAYVEIEDFEGASWCLSDLRLSLLPIRSGTEENADVEDEALLSALDAYLAVKLGRESSSLDQKALHLEQVFDRLVRSRKSRPVDESGSGLGYYPRETAIFGSLVEVLVAARGEVGATQALERILSHQALSALCRRLGARPCSLSEVRQELLTSSTHGVLLFQRAPAHTGGCRLFAFDRERLRWTSVGSLASWWRWSERLLTELSSASNDSAGWEDVSRQTTDLIFPPGIRALIDEWDRITLVGFDGESWFPFDGLLYAGKPFAVQKEICHLATLPLGVHLARRPPAREPDYDLLLVIAPEHSDAAAEAFSDLQPISVTDTQVRSLTSPFSPESVVILEKERATLESITGLSGSFSVLHLFAHGVQRGESSPFTGILLGSGDPLSTGILLPADVPALPRSRLALLSACGTGKGLPRVMEGGLNNLAGAFFEQGSDAVVVAHEELMVGQTLEVMARVTEEIARGASPAASMRAARAELMGKGVTDPRVFSNLRVWGLGFRPVFPERRKGPDSRVVITLVIFAVVGAYLVWWRRKSS